VKEGGSWRSNGAGERVKLGVIRQGKCNIIGRCRRRREDWGEGKIKRQEERGRLVVSE
jgi:hypothetical protein